MRTRPEPIPFKDHPLSKMQPTKGLKRTCVQIAISNQSETDEEPRVKKAKAAEADTIKKIKSLYRLFRSSPHHFYLHDPKQPRLSNG